nr:MAG TPA: Homeobox protein [Caudoviricetes sp.]
MPKLSTRQKNKIIVEYVEGNGKISQSQLAEKYGVTRKTISKILSNEEVRNQVTEAKKDSVLSMIEYIKAKSERIQHLIDIALETSDQQMREASLRDKMGAVKILIEKFFPPEDEREEDLPSPITIVVKDTSKDE